MKSSRNEKSNNIYKQFLKEYKRNELLFKELEDKHLLSASAVQNITSNISWQKREIASLHSDLLFLERCSHHLVIDFAIKEINQKRFFEKLKDKFTLFLTKLKIDLKVLVLKVQ